MSTAPKVLVIDDDKHFATLVAGQLRAAGYQALIAFDPPQGLMLAQRELPNLILLDLHMPAGGGLALLGRLVGNVKTNGIPVVMVTAETNPGLEADLVRQGAAGFLAKPCDGAALLAKVHQTLGAPPADGKV
ncbi:MAG TPA: response regulator [Gemmatimonadales bacterium]|nr:response regulator [Gemmatimonadales bacterium]